MQRITRGDLTQAVVAVVARRIAAFEGGGVIVEQRDLGEEAVVQTGVWRRRGRAVLRRVVGDATIGVWIGIGSGIHDRGRGSELRSGKRGVEGRGVDEGLEDGSGGPVGDGVIELRDAVVAATHQRQYLTSVRIERHQRDLWAVDRLGMLGLRASFFDQLIDGLHALGNGFVGGLLQIRIE